MGGLLLIAEGKMTTVKKEVQQAKSFKSHLKTKDEEQRRTAKNSEEHKRNSWIDSTIICTTKCYCSQKIYYVKDHFPCPMDNLSETKPRRSQAFPKKSKKCILYDMYYNVAVAYSLQYLVTAHT